MTDYQTLLVPHDFSDHAAAALRTAVDLAGRLGARIHLLHVIQPAAVAYPGFGEGIVPPIDLGAMRENAHATLEALAKDASSEPIEVHAVEGLGIPDTIEEVARQIGADLVVMGTHGRTGLAHVFLGSVAERTLRKSSCPVLTVKAPGGDAAG